MSGQIAEVIAYNRHLDSGEVFQIESYLNDKYADLLSM